MIPPPMLLPKVKQSPIGLEDLFTQSTKVQSKEYINSTPSNIPDISSSDLKQTLSEPKEVDFKAAVAIQIEPQKAEPKIISSPEIEQSEFLASEVNTKEVDLPQPVILEAKLVPLVSQQWPLPPANPPSIPLPPSVVLSQNHIDPSPAAPKNTTSQLNFQFDQLEDMGEIIDIGFDEDIDADIYLNSFNSGGNKKARNPPGAGTAPKSPAKSQEVEETKQIEITESSGTLQALSIDPNEFMLQNLKSEDLMIQVNPDYPLSLSFKKTKSQHIMNSELNFGPSKNIEILNNQQKDQILLHLLKERGCYKEKLRMAESEINMTKDHIERMKRGESDLPTDMSKSSLHLAFLFSSPLIRRTKSSIENIMQLDYSSEISDILKVCSRRKYELKYKIDVATVSNVRSTITD